MQQRNSTHSTTVVGVIRDGKAVIGADGQVTIGQTVMKHNARKVRKMFNGTVLAGFAGSAADALTLSDKFEEKLEQYHGNFERAAVELARDWRTDKYLRRLEALLAVLTTEKALIISGTGDVIEPDDGIIAIGSGGSYALAAARALMRFTDLPARSIVEESLRIAADICIYTNRNLLIEEL
ncbi:MAG: ATP-dependent protease subunit HslV [Bacteroidota bacterium]|nr:ATP-dependent protease subunit HslV [Bacteroidota bacterium]